MILSSYAIVRGFLDFATFYTFSSAVYHQIKKLILEGLLKKQNGLFYLAMIFHRGPQHWPRRHVGCRSVLAA